MKSQLQNDFVGHPNVWGSDSTLGMTHTCAQMLRTWPKLIHVALCGGQASSPQSAGSMSNPPQASPVPLGGAGEPGP